jgi:hypothetical protein
VSEQPCTDWGVKREKMSGDTPSLVPDETVTGLENFQTLEHHKTDGTDNEFLPDLAAVELTMG